MFPVIEGSGRVGSGRVGSGRVGSGELQWGREAPMPHGSFPSILSLPLFPYFSLPYFNLPYLTLAYLSLGRGSPSEDGENRTPIGIIHWFTVSSLAIRVRPRVVWSGRLLSYLILSYFLCYVMSCSVLFCSVLFCSVLLCYVMFDRSALGAISRWGTLGVWYYIC